MKKLLLIFLICFSNAICAANSDSSAILSPNCSEADIKAIAGDALLSISKNQSWGDEVRGYIVTLDTDKLSYSELAGKMNKKGCFDKPQPKLDSNSTS